MKRGENESEMQGLPTVVKFLRAANSGQQVGMPLRISMHICMHVYDTHMHSFNICIFLRTYVCMYSSVHKNGSARNANQVMLFIMYNVYLCYFFSSSVTIIPRNE